MKAITVMPDAVVGDINLTLTRTLLLRLIEGIEPPMKWGETRFVEFTGNQHNPDWEWRMEYISGLPDSQLVDFYVELCAAKNIPVY